MRFALYGLLGAVILFVVSGGHLLFLPLFFMLPLGGLFGRRRRRGRPGAAALISSPGRARYLR